MAKLYASSSNLQIKKLKEERDMLMFVLGCMVGGFIGVAAMCIFTVSGQQSRLEEERQNNKV